MAMLGDSSKPGTDLQFQVSCVLLLVGIMVISTILGSLSSMLHSLDSMKNAKAEQLDAINGYLAFRKVDD